MTRNVMNVAVALLLSLGVTACGSKHQETVISTQPNISAAEVAAAKRAAETAQDNEQAAKNEAESAKAELAEAQENLAAAQSELENAQAELAKAEEKVAAAKEDAQQKAMLLRSSLVGSTAASEGYKLVTQNDTETLDALIRDENLASAIGANSRVHAVAIEQGTLMSANTLSYAGYGVVREYYNVEDKSAPANSYFYVVNTPTTELSKVTDVRATYKGSVSYSMKNNLGVTTLAYNPESERTAHHFVLNLDNNTVSGYANTATSNRNPEGVNIITFENAQVKLENGVVGFNGAATFNPTFSGTGATTGSYQGSFAGENAEQVVGTFATDAAVNGAGMQGAFIGEKQ